MDISSELEELVNKFTDKYKKEIERDYNRKMPKEWKERAEMINGYFRINWYSIPKEVETFKFQMLYELYNGCYWHATDFWDQLKKELSKEDLKTYAKEMIEQAKVGKRGKSNYSWIVLKYDDGTLTEFIDDDLLTEAVNKGFWEIFENETAAFHSLKYYRAIMNHKEKLEIKNVPIDKSLRATPLTLIDENGYTIYFQWPDEDYIKIVDKFKDKLPKEDYIKLIRPIIELEIKNILSEENEKFRISKKYEEYLNHPTIQELFEEYIGEYASYLDSRFELLVPYWNVDEKTLKKFISEKVKDELPLDFVKEEFPIKYLTKDTKLKIQNELIEELKKQQPWDKSIVPNMSYWKKSVELEYIPKGIAKEFFENEIKKYLKQKRISKKKLTDLYNHLLSYKENYKINLVSEELKEEIRKRAGIEKKVYQPTKTQSKTIQTKLF